MKTQEYINKIFETRPLPEIPREKKLNNAIIREATRLNEELNIALKKVEILQESILSNRQFDQSPEKLAPTREALESATLALLPYVEVCKLTSRLSKCFYSVSNMYQEELQRAAALYDGGARHLQEAIAEGNQVLATYVTAGCLAGKIANLERSLQLCSDNTLKSAIHNDLFASKSNFLMTCLGVMAHEIDIALRQSAGRTESAPQDPALEALSSLSPPGNLTEEVYQGLKDQLMLINFLITKLQQSRGFEMSATELAAHMQSLDHWMNAARVHLIGLAHRVFDGIFQAEPASQAGSSQNANAWHERLFKVCLDAVDALDYLLYRKADGSARIPNTKLPLVYQVEISEEEATRLGLLKLGIESSSDFDKSQSGTPPAEQTTHEAGAESGAAQEAETAARAELNLAEAVPDRQLERPDNIAASQAAKAERLLNQKHFEMADFYLKNFNDHMPETAFNAFENDCKAADTAISKLESVATSLTGDEGLKQKLTDRIQELKERTESLRGPALRIDYLKCYKFPQARHWAELINRGEVDSIRIGPKPIGKGADTFYELEIRSKPNRFDETARSAWLHIHVDKLLPKKIDEKSAWKLLRAQPGNILAAHLKSDFYRKKGKEWEHAEMAKGHYNSLVKRSKANAELMAALDRFILGAVPPAAASTSRSG